MAIKILHKASSTAGVAPGTGDLQVREIGLNTADGKMFLKLGNNTIVTFTEDSTSPNKFAHGTGAPGSGDGQNGWHYFDTSAGDLYYKSGGTWSLIFTFSSGGVTFVDEELVGTGDGSTTDFNLADTPSAGSLHVYVGGARLRGGTGNDYTLSGTTISFATAPGSSEVIVADYRT